MVIMTVIRDGGDTKTEYTVPKLVDTNRMAAIIGVSPKTIRAWRWQKRIPAHVLGGRAVRYDPAEVLRAIDRKEGGPDGV